MNKVVISFLISFILLMIVIALNRITYNSAKRFTDRTERSRTIIKLYENIEVELRSAEIYSPTYEKSSASELYALYKADMDSIAPNLLRLKTLSGNNKVLSAINDSLSSIIQQQLPTLRLKNMVEIIESGEMWRFRELEKAHQLVRNGLALEEELLEETRRDTTESNNLNNSLTVLLAILAMVIITIIFVHQFFLNKKSLWLEGFLESILNTTQNGIVYYKAVRKKGKIVDFKVEFANNAIQNLLGIDTKKVIGKKLSELNSFSWKTDLFLIYAKVANVGEPISLERFYQHGGVDRWLYFSISKLKDGVTVAFHDISELKRYEDELKTNITALKQSNQELEEYAYAASHDLQEPLRKIKTFGSFLRDTQQTRLDEKGRQQLEKILQSADRMSLLIKDLLSFSSLKTKEEFELTSLTEIFENILQDMEVLIEQKKAIITHDSLPEIEAIPVHMNQLFYNLVNNSLKFSKEEIPLHLDVSCKLLSDEDVKYIPGLDNANIYYEITFSDNGIGFNQDYAHQIFGLFKRLNDKTVYAGSGIGLALCKKVVTNHKGIILANGKEGVGAQFYIYLPQQQKSISALPQKTL